MAKQHALPEAPKKVIVYPSLYGSHSSMIDKDKTEALTNHSRVICVDALGAYETDRDRLDTRLHDPNRTSSLRIIEKKVEAKETK